MGPVEQNGERIKEEFRSGVLWSYDSWEDWSQSTTSQEVVDFSCDYVEFGHRFAEETANTGLGAFVITMRGE